MQPRQVVRHRLSLGDAARPHRYARRMNEVDDAKREIRHTVRAARRARSDVERSRLAASLTQHLIAVVQATSPARIATYLSSPDEPSTRGLLQWAREQGLEVWLPAIRGSELWWGIDDGSEVPGLLGTTEPTRAEFPPDRIAEVPLLLIPACSVDARGMRLGWGAGFLDRTLTRVPGSSTVYALVFETDIVSAVPTAPHDERVDGFITPSGLTTTP